MIVTRDIVCLEIGSMTLTSVVCPLREDTPVLENVSAFKFKDTAHLDPHALSDWSYSRLTLALKGDLKRPDKFCLVIGVGIFGPQKVEYTASGLRATDVAVYLNVGVIGGKFNEEMINDFSGLISFEIRDRHACAKFTKFDDFYGDVVDEIPGGTRHISVSGTTAHES
jgi:hypothetical protein